MGRTRSIDVARVFPRGGMHGPSHEAAENKIEDEVILYMR